MAPTKARSPRSKRCGTLDSTPSRTWLITGGVASMVTVFERTVVESLAQFSARHVAYTLWPWRRLTARVVYVRSATVSSGCSSTPSARYTARCMRWSPDSSSTKSRAAILNTCGEKKVMGG